MSEGATPCRWCALGGLRRAQVLVSSASNLTCAFLRIGAPGFQAAGKRGREGSASWAFRSRARRDFMAQKTARAAEQSQQFDDDMQQFPTFSPPCSGRLEQRMPAPPKIGRRRFYSSRFQPENLTSSQCAASEKKRSLRLSRERSGGRRSAGEARYRNWREHPFSVRAQPGKRRQAHTTPHS